MISLDKHQNPINLYTTGKINNNNKKTFKSIIGIVVVNLTLLDDWNIHSYSTGKLEELSIWILRLFYKVFNCKE